MQAIPGGLWGLPQRSAMSAPARVMLARPQTAARRDRLDRALAVLAATTLVLAWLWGARSQTTDLRTYLLRLFPQATDFDAHGDIYIATRAEPAGSQTVVGYAKTAQSGGYAGPVTVLAGIDPAGTVVGIEVISHKETPSYFQLILNSRFFDELLGRSYQDPLMLDQDVDAVTGATFTSRAIVDSLRRAVREMAVSELGAPAPPAEKKPVRWGLPESVLLALYAVGYFAHRPRFPAKKWVRWGMLIAGLVVLGFWFNQPLTLANIATLLSGYWPEWQSNLYWYLLLGGLILVATVDGKNAYCAWFCPFGAAQECLAAVGGAKKFTPRRGREWLRWTQRGLAWLALIFALTLRRPGMASFEPFGTLFQFKGSTLSWVLLVIVLLMSLAVYRPWCNYLCPLDPIFDLISAGRRWSLEVWRKSTRRSSNP